MIRAGTGISSAEDGIKAADEAVTQALSKAGIKQAGFLLVFGTSHYAKEYRAMLETISERAGTDQIIGCTGVGVITEEGEIEEKRALALMAVAPTQGLAVEPFLEGVAPGEEETVAAKIVKACVRRKPTSNKLLLLFPDPYKCNATRILDELSSGVDGLSVVGAGPGESGNLGSTMGFSKLEALQHVVSGMLFDGDFTFNIGVSQACRPFAGPHTLTRVEGNRILELDGKPALNVLSEGIEELKIKSHGMATGPIFVGAEVRDDILPVESGSYLVRSILGVDEKKGSVIIGEDVSAIKHASFVCRDPEGATEDLYRMLELSKKALPNPSFGIYFDCCGRGTSLYKMPSCDVNAIAEYFGDMPLIGLHGNFELAPSYGKNRLHTYSGVLVLISDTKSN